MSLRFKRHCPLLVALVLVTLVFTLGLGEQRIVAYNVPFRNGAPGKLQPELVTRVYSSVVAVLD